MRRAAQRANEVLLAEPQHTNNYPPADSSEISDAEGKQIYRIDNWEYALETNCRLLSTSVRLSDVLPNGAAGLGLFATRHFEEGEIIGFLWGKFVAQEEWDSMVKRGVDSTHRGVEEDYVTPIKNGIYRSLSVPVQSNGATLLMASQQCPMAYINQGHGEATNNVDIIHPKYPFDSAVQPAYKYVEFVVKTKDGQGVSTGEELTTNYGWNKQYLQELRSLYAIHVKQLGKTRPGMLRTYDSLRAQHTASAAAASPGISSVVSEGSLDCHSNISSDTHRRRAALERSGDRHYESVGDVSAQIPYACCKNQCYHLASRSFVIQARSVTKC